MALGFLCPAQGRGDLAIAAKSRVVNGFRILAQQQAFNRLCPKASLAARSPPTLPQGDASGLFVIASKQVIAAPRHTFKKPLEHALHQTGRKWPSKGYPTGAFHGPIPAPASWPFSGHFKPAAGDGAQSIWPWAPLSSAPPGIGVDVMRP